MGEKPKILVVDDEPSIRDSIKLLLEKDFEIIEASNGFEGVELYKKQKPDIVLMDIMMPLMSGIEATKKIIEFDPNAKILIITAYSERKGEEAIRAGARDILPKPFRRKKLVEFINKHLGDPSVSGGNDESMR